MAYTINKTDGSILTTVSDGTLDETTNIGLIGQGYSGYGEIQNENFVKLLENFANTTANPPDKPIVGQLFYDSTQQQIQVYDGSAFKAVSGCIVSATEPTTGSTGDLWLETGTSQVYVYTGSAWALVGPERVASTGAVSATITDSTGVDRLVLQYLVNNTIVAMTSTVEFTPQATIVGFATIKKGFTLSTNISGNKFHGTATDADALAGVAAANYLRSNTSDTLDGTLSITQDASLVLGDDGDITMTQSGANFTVKNVTTDGNILFNINDGGSDTTVLTLNGASSNVTVANTLSATAVSSTTVSAATSVTAPTVNTNIIQSSDSTEIRILDNVSISGNITADNLGGGIAADSVSSTELKDSVTLIIYDSSGSAVKTLFGAGS